MPTIGKIDFDMIPDDEVMSRWHKNDRAALITAWNPSIWRQRYLPAWKNTNGSEWAYLLSHQPQFASHCDWSKLKSRPDVWIDLLVNQPRLINHQDCPKFTVDVLADLFEAQPELISHFNWSILWGYDWVKLLVAKPELASHCDWSRLDGSDLEKLFAERPELITCLEGDNEQIFREFLNARKNAGNILQRGFAAAFPKKNRFSSLRGGKITLSSNLDLLVLTL